MPEQVTEVLAGEISSSWGSISETAPGGQWCEAGTSPFFSPLQGNEREGGLAYSGWAGSRPRAGH